MTETKKITCTGWISNNQIRTGSFFLRVDGNGKIIKKSEICRSKNVEETRLHVPVVVSLLVVDANTEADWCLCSFKDGVR